MNSDPKTRTHKKLIIKFKKHDNHNLEPFQLKNGSEKNRKKKALQDNKYGVYRNSEFKLESIFKRKSDLFLK
jgi:hypothetical protein